jgi:hypothetical protein
MILGFAGIGLMTYRRKSSALRSDQHPPGLLRDRLRAVFLFDDRRRYRGAIRSGMKFA